MRLGLLEPPPGPLTDQQPSTSSTATSASDREVSKVPEALPSPDGTHLPESRAMGGEITTEAATGGKHDQQQQRHEDGAEWVELRPRWPLTTDKHPRLDRSPASFISSPSCMPSFLQAPQARLIEGQWCTADSLVAGISLCL